jgi:hypothetical protein
VQSFRVWQQLRPRHRIRSRQPDAGKLIEIAGRAPCFARWVAFLSRAAVGKTGGAQRLDEFALNTLPHTARKRICCEVKVSRGDFLSELKHPLKRRIS